MQIMTINHARWQEFYEKLSDLVPDLESCNGRIDRPNAKAVLAEMGFAVDEIETSLNYFEGSGGFCDCEILMNLVPLEPD